MRRVLGWFVSLLTCGLGVASAADEPLIALQTAQRTYVGRRVVHNEELVYLQSQDGQYHELLLKDLKGFRQLEGRFRPWDAATVQDHLRQELGRDFEVVGTGQYLVAGAANQVGALAQTFEQVARSFHQHFGVRGLELHEAEFPLVAIVFPDQVSFARYAGRQGVRISPGLKGLYMPLSNHVLMYVETKTPEKVSFMPALAPQKRGPQLFQQPGWASVSGSLQDTIIHEATHQVAFNCGLHSRLGENPTWVVEGLATVFEAPGIREPKFSQPSAKWNVERLNWFRQYQAHRRPANALEQMVLTDDLFLESPLDAYSQAWAWTFFLMETRPTEYVKYLQLMARHEALVPYTPAARKADFETFFGNEYSLLEAHFQRFLNAQR